MKSVFPAVLVVLVSSGLVAADPVTLFSQPINPDVGGIFSELDGQHPLTDFTLPLGGTVTQVCWWGLYRGFDGMSLGPTRFAISFFDDYDGDPVYQDIVFVAAQSTPYESHLGIDEYPVYFYESAIAPSFPVPAGQQMWITIGEADSRTTGGGDTQWGWSRAIGYANDYAFVLKGEAVPLPGAALIGLLGLGTASAALRRRRDLTR